MAVNVVAVSTQRHVKARYGKAVVATWQVWQ